MTFCDSIVDSLTIIRAIRCQRGNFRVDLIKQHRYFGDVTDIVRRQLRGNNLMCDSINPKVQLAPPSARPDAVFVVEPFSVAVNLEAGAVDKKMQGLRAIGTLRQDRQSTTTTTQGRMIGDGDIDPEHIGDRPQQTFGLPQRLVDTR